MVCQRCWSQSGEQKLRPLLQSSDHPSNHMLVFQCSAFCKHLQLVICAALFKLSETSPFNLLSCKRSKPLHSYTLAVFLCELFTVVFLVFSHPVLAKTILPPVSCHLSFMYEAKLLDCPITTFQTLSLTSTLEGTDVTETIGQHIESR